MAKRDGRKDFFDYVSPFTKRYVRPLLDLIRKPFNLALTVACLILIIFFFSVLVKSFVISFLIVLGGLSKIYQRYTHLPLGFEFVMFSTIVSGYIYGSFIGIFVGIVSFALATHFSVRYTAYVIPSFIIYSLAGAFAQLFGNIVFAGLFFSILFVVILSFISLVFMASRPDRVFMFALTSLAWNIWIFTSLTPTFVKFFS